MALTHAGFGAVAQLGERDVRNVEAEGSNPFRSTRYNNMTGPATLIAFAGSVVFS